MHLFIENTYAVDMASKMKLKAYAALIDLWHVNFEKSSFYRMTPSDFIFAEFHSTILPQLDITLIFN